jgi:hypothetical protein
LNLSFIASNFDSQMSYFVSPLHSSPFNSTSIWIMDWNLQACKSK